jgi:hypothetical protein
VDQIFCFAIFDCFFLLFSPDFLKFFVAIVSHWAGGPFTLGLGVKLCFESSYGPRSLVEDSSQQPPPSNPSAAASRSRRPQPLRRASENSDLDPYIGEARG